MARQWLERTIGVGVLITAVALLAGVTGAAEVDASLLAEKRWSETAFGMSLRPPAGARTIEQTADPALVTFLVDESMSLRVFFRQAQRAVTLDEVRERAVEQFLALFPAAGVVRDEAAEVRIGQRRGARWYFIVPEEDGQEWMTGQAFMLIDPYTVAMFQLEADVTSYDRARQVFEAVLSSVELMPPQELDEQRTAMVEAGHAWLESISHEQFQSALPDRQLLRVLEDGKDVGYRRVEARTGQQLGVEGLEVVIQSRMLVGNDYAFDARTELFMAEAAPLELWSTVTTRRALEEHRGLQQASRQPARAPRPQGGRGGAGRSPVEALAEHWRHRQPPPVPFQTPEQGWTDTGLRSHGRITVSRESPTNVDHREWDVPPRAYLSQLAAHALPGLMVAQARAGHTLEPMAFYAYHPTAARVALRTVRMERTQEGGWRVYDRPAPDLAEQTFTYDASGRLIERQAGDGRIFKPATEGEIRAIWQRR